MTVVKFHGLLAKKFGSQVKLHLGNLNFLYAAIDSVKNGFVDFLKKCEKNSQFYSISKNTNENVIHICPAIVGFGPIAIPIYIIIALIVVGGAMAIIGAVTKNAALLRIGGYILQIAGLALSVSGSRWWGLLVSVIGSLATGYGDYISAMQKLEKMKAPQSQLYGGGGASSIDSNGRSYVFARTSNLATQGTAITIGYGKTKIGSKLISVAVKTTSSSVVFDGEVWENDLSEIYG